MTAPPTRDGPRVNDEIRAPQVRLIDADGEMQGVMSARDAWLRAQAVGLDLLEISPPCPMQIQFPVDCLGVVGVDDVFDLWHLLVLVSGARPGSVTVYSL